MLAPGTQLGPYQISAPLGAGGMGEVYRAKDSRLDRDVAVKVLPTQFAQDEARLSRFQREAKAVAALSHPNILAIHDYGTDSGQTFAVMELLEGQTLRRRVAHGAIPWRKAAEIAVAIADGLAAAHGKGIIHRDLKADNIFLTTDGRVKILDFGLARIQPALPSGDSPTGTYHPDQTEAGTILGTIGYMSPEQVRGKEVDAKSDIFSLGCLIYEMVTGQRAFAAETAAETMAAILHDEPPDLADSSKKIPLELQRIIQHCLEKNPASRFHSAHDLAFALRAVSSDTNLPHAVKSPTHSYSRYWPVAVLLVGGLAVLAAYFARRPAEPVQSIEAIAVLPFVNETNDAEAEHLSDGMPESIIQSLYDVHGLTVRPFNSTARYKERLKTIDLNEVARQLKVQAVLTGKLSPRKEGFALSVELTDVRGARGLWLGRFDSQQTNAQTIPKAIAKEVCAKLGHTLTPDEQKRLAKSYTDDREAFLLYLKGRHYWNKRSLDALNRGIEYFRQALDKDPNFALAHVGLADCYVLLPSRTPPRDPKEVYPLAKAHVQKAMELDGTLAEAHATLGFIKHNFDWDWTGAESEYRRAIELNPSYPTAHHWYAIHLSSMGRLDEGIASYRRAQELDPLSLIINTALGGALVRAGQEQQGLELFRSVLEMDPNFAPALSFRAAAHEHSGRYAEAIEELEKLGQVTGDKTAKLSDLGYLYGRTGKIREARQVLEELERLSRQQTPLPYSLALVHNGLGETDKTFAWLEQAYEARSNGLLGIQVNPRFASLKTDPRFQDLLRRMGLADKPTQSRSANEGLDQPIDTLAVLPFDNQSPDPEAGYLGDDITYSLTDGLMRVRELIVRTYGSASRYKPGSFDAKTAGRALQAQAVLRGGIQKRGDEVLIEVELMHVGEDRRIWGDRYPGKLADRLALQQRIIQEVPQRLRLALTGQEKQDLARLPTQSLKAHELYILGRLAWNRRNAAEIQKAIEHFEQAIQIDPNYALAYAGLADCHVIQTTYSREPPKRARTKARDAALKALALDRSLAEPRYTLATLQKYDHGDYAGAERSFQLAVTQDPHYATGRISYGFLLSCLGRHDEAIGQLQLARQLDPHSLIIRTALGRVLYAAGKLDAAEAEWRATLEQSPHFIPAMTGLGGICIQRKRYPEAIQVLRDAWEQEKNLVRLGPWLGYAYAVSGDAPRAREMLREMQELAKQFHVSPLELAFIHLGLGEREEALTLLEQAYQEESDFMIWINVEPMLDSLRNEPRFQKIIADMKFPQ